MSAISTTEVVVDGVRSPTLERGPRERRDAVVFVHGNPGPKEDWVELMTRLDPGVRALAPDLPGFGDADRPRRFDYSVDGYARHLAGILDQLGVERAHLVLHDFGGPWGLRWAADRRDRLASVTLINTGVMLGLEWHYFARIWQTPILGELFQLATTRFAYEKLLDRDNGRPLPKQFYDRIFDKLDWGQKRAVLKLYRATRDPAPGTRFLVERLGGCEVPALVIWGDRDVYLPARIAERQREVFPRAEIHHLSDCGHWPFVEDPERVAGLVVPFLSRAAAARP